MFFELLTKRGMSVVVVWVYYIPIYDGYIYTRRLTRGPLLKGAYRPS